MNNRLNNKNNAKPIYIFIIFTMMHQLVPLTFSHIL